ncbi:MAG: SRPBCC family protein [Nitriliruptoraceae bacterium]
MDMTVSREIDASPDVVWEVITDIEHSPQVISSIQAIDRLDDGDGFGVGTRWRETRTMFGREAEEVMEVSAIEAGVSYTVVAVSGKTVYTSVFRLDPIEGSRSRLTMTFGAESKGLAKLMGATIGRLFRGASRKMLERDLDDIAAAAEGRSAS